MFRKLIAPVVASATLFSGSASAFHGWFYCHPRYYYPPPVVYYYPVYLTPPVCPPALPASPPKDRVPPKPMAEVESPSSAKQKENKSKGGLTPAEFRIDPPRTTELATPTPAPPPSADRTNDIPATKSKPVPAAPEVRPMIVLERTPEPATPPAPKTVDIPLPMNERQPPKSDVPTVKPTEPGLIPLIPVPDVSTKTDGGSVGSGAIRPEAPAGSLQIPPIDIPAPTTAPEKRSTSKSSPLVNERTSPTVTIRSVTGSPPALNRYAVRFYNHTDTPFELTVEAGSITLPAKHFVDVQIGRVFTWKAGALPSRKTEIPADAAGMEMEIRP